jgi:hypothetical protein
VAKSMKDDGARYYGPYRSATSARKTVDVINQVLPLRTCTRSFKDARSYGKPCILLDLGQCLGPCAGRADHDEYRRAVDVVVSFLDGRDEALNERLLEELQGAALRLDFEKAARLRRDIRSVQTIVEEQTRIRDAENLHNLLLVLPSSDPDCREIMVVVRGRLWAQLRVERVPEIEAAAVDVDPGDDGVISERPVELAGGAEFAIAELAERLERSLVRAKDATDLVRDHETVDESSILNRFLFRNAGHPAAIPIPVTDDGVLSPDVHALARMALAVSDDVLATLDQRKPGEPDADEAQTGDAASPATESEASSFSEAL